VEYLPERRVSRRVSRWEEDEMIQIGARKAERALLFDQRDPGAISQMLAAFIAG